MTFRSRQDGFSLIEVLVALLILSIVAAGLAQMIVTAQTTRRTNALRLEASQLAVEQTEQIRAGHQPTGPVVVGAFSYAATLEALPRYADLKRLRVTVQWIDRQPRQLELVTLLAQPGANE